MSAPVPEQDRETADVLAPLETSLRWHFACHAAEPDKSYASLGVQNARLIVADLLARVKREAAAEGWDEGYDAGHTDARAVQATYPEPTANPYAEEARDADHA